jgi:hypothetical protein
MNWATGPFAQGEVSAECQMIAVHNCTVPYQIPCNSRMYLNVGDEKLGAEGQVSRISLADSLNRAVRFPQWLGT